MSDDVDWPPCGRCGRPKSEHVAVTGFLDMPMGYVCPTALYSLTPAQWEAIQQHPTQQRDAKAREFLNKVMPKEES